MSGKRSLTRGLWVSAAVLAAWAAGAGAQDTIWFGSGDWSVAGNWHAGEPTPSVAAHIERTDGPTITQAGETCSSLWVGGLSAGRVTMTGGDLTVSVAAHVGSHAWYMPGMPGTSGVFDQQGGTHTVNGTLGLGDWTGDVGTYLLSGGQLVVQSYMSVGWDGAGTFAQSGGSVNVGANVAIGGDEGSGVYTLSGAVGTSTLSSGGQMHVSRGRFEWYGGAIDLYSPACLVIVHEEGTLAMGTGFLNGGTTFDVTDLILGNYFVTPPTPGTTRVRLENGTLEVTNGKIARHQHLYTGMGRLVVGSADGDGTYDFSESGSLHVNELIVGSGGAGGTGTFLWTAGQSGPPDLDVVERVRINADGAMIVGMDWDMPADLEVAGVLDLGGNYLSVSGTTFAVRGAGSVTAGNLNIFGTCAMTQTGGAIDVAGTLSISGTSCRLEGGSLNAGVVDVNTSLVVAGGALGTPTTGYLNNLGRIEISDGACTLGHVYNTGMGGLNGPSESGIYVKGGSLSAEDLHNEGDYVQTAGTTTVNDTFANWGTVVLSGGTMTAQTFLNQWDWGMPLPAGDAPAYEGYPPGMYISGTASFAAPVVNNDGYWLQTGGTAEVTAPGGAGVFTNIQIVEQTGGLCTVDTFNNYGYGYEPMGKAGEQPAQPWYPGLFLSGTADFNATTVNNYAVVEHGGGSMTVGKFNNYYTQMYYVGGEAPAWISEGVPGLYVHGTADFDASVLVNYGKVYHEAGRLAATTVHNYADEGWYGPAGGEAPAQEMYYLGIYVTGDADFAADEVHNRGSFWQDGGTIADRAGGMGVFINYGEGGEWGGGSPGYFVMGMGPMGTPTGSGADPSSAVFRDHMVNYGTFVYVDGVFEGSYEHRAGFGGFGQAKDFTAEAGIVNWGQLANEPWMDITANGPGLSNYGRLEMTGGTLGGTGVVNQAMGELHTRRHAVVDTTLVNYGQVTTEDALTVTGQIDNHGGIFLSEQQHLVCEGGLDNYGVVSLDGGGVVSGDGMLVNKPGGLIEMRGGGAVTAMLHNFGTMDCYGSMSLVLSNFLGNDGVIEIDDGKLHVVNDFTSRGVIWLPDDGMIGGGDINNEGTICGSGIVGSRVENHGVIRPSTEEPIWPGELAFTAAGSSCPVGGRIDIPAGNSVVFVQGLAYLGGTLSMAGGTFDNNARDLPVEATGQIMGHGTLRAGTLLNDGQVRLSGGDTGIFAAVSNAGHFEVIGSTATVYGDLTNDGTVKNTDGTLRILGTFVNNGTMISDPADNRFADVDNGPAGAFVGGAGDRFIVSGDFANASTRNTDWDTAAAEMAFVAGADSSHVLGVPGADGGCDGGWVDNFAWGKLTIGAGQTVTLVDGNAVPGGALYLGELDLAGVGSQLAAGAITVYYCNGGPAKQFLMGDANMDGRVGIADLVALADNYGATAALWRQGDFNADAIVGIADLVALADRYGSMSCGADPNVPEPATLILLVPGAVAILRRRRA